MKTKKQKRIIYIVPQQHWDPFWKFLPEVSERMGVRNIRKVLDILKEVSEFRYSIDQAYLWELFQKYFPERGEELKQRVREGKIELTNGGYVNPDFNLPSGESLIRNLAYCQKIWQKEFGVKAKVVSIQDSFGQSGQLPQIFSKMGLKYHTAKRGASKDLPAVFVWQGVDGTKIIFDRQPLGHHGLLLFPLFSTIPNKIKPSETFERIVRKYFALPFALVSVFLPDIGIWTATKAKFWRFKSALKFLTEKYPDYHIFIPHGFGMDGGMPFAWIVNLTHFYSQLSGDKAVVTLPSEYFKHIEQIKEKLKLLVVEGELNGPTEKNGEACGALPGSYSTRIDVKQRARKMERLLYLAELLESIKWLSSGQFNDLTELWKQKFLTDFHDGICGTLTDENYRLLKRKAEWVIEQSEKIVKENLVSLAPRNSVFNPLPWTRNDLVKINSKLYLVKAEPLGFTPIESITVESQFKFDINQLTTPFYQVKWTQDNLEIYQNGQKITGEKFARLRLQDEKGDTYFWDVSGEEWNKIESIKLIENQGLRATIEIRSTLRKNKIIQLIHFYLHTPRIDFETIIDNQEKDIRIQVHLPFNLKTQVNADPTSRDADQRRDQRESTLIVEREIPAGFIREGESNGQAKWKDVFGEKYVYYDNIKCVQNWIYFGNLKEGIAIFNDGLPEHEIIDNSCFLTLLRCVGKVGIEGKGLNKFTPKNSVPWRAGSPHPIPLAQLPGERKFRYAICPVKRQDVAKECYEFLFPLIYCQGQNKNFLSLFSISDKSVIPLAIKKSEEGENLVVRLLETEGKTKTVELKFNPDIQIKSVKLTNLLEEPISNLPVEDNKVKITIKSQEIVTLVFNF
jgi:alpha-mannosidase